MDVGNFHEIWMEQCGAARTIRTRHGLAAALDYLVGEKLLNFAEAAADRPHFARELPRFCAEVRLMFTPDEIKAELKRVERGRCQDGRRSRRRSSPRQRAPDDDAATRLDLIKEVLLAPMLGTS